MPRHNFPRMSRLRRRQRAITRDRVEARMRATTNRREKSQRSRSNGNTVTDRHHNKARR